MAKKMEIIADNRNCTAANLGDLNAAGIGAYEYAAPALPKPFPGKVFLAESLKLSGMEVSFQVMPPNMGMPFSHKHRKNEELYVVLKGSGEFGVDDAVMPIREGSVVRVAPDGLRTWKNTGNEPMIVMCIQARAGTLDAFTGSDGYLV